MAPIKLRIDVGAMALNVSAIRRQCPGAAVMGVVKAGAYGADAPELARHLAACGVDQFAVSHADEGQHRPARTGGGRVRGRHGAISGRGGPPAPHGTGRRERPGSSRHDGLQHARQSGVASSTLGRRVHPKPSWPSPWVPDVLRRLRRAQRDEVVSETGGPRSGDVADVTPPRR
jgi:hypothetical protein